MFHFIGPIVTLYKAFIEGIRPKKFKSQIEKEIQIKRKIIRIKLIFEDIIDTAEQIFSIVDTCINQDKEINKKTEEKLEHLLLSQSDNVQQLIIHFRDDTFEYIFKLFAPRLQEKIIKLIKKKGSRIDWLHGELILRTILPVRKLYEKSYHNEGIKLLSELKSCSKDLSNFIRSNMSLEDAIAILAY